MGKKEFLHFLDLPRRPKPREVGITVFADMFLPTQEVKALLEVASNVIDYAKLIHIGLTDELQEGWLERKLGLYKENGVKTYPGGVPFQVAVVQDKVPEYFDWLVEMGFDAVEIAEDAMPTKLDPAKRDQMIRMALDKGLEVFTELGEKHPDEPMSLEKAYEDILHDLSLGVLHVTIERSELDTYIKGDASPLVNLIQKVGMKNLLLEPGPFGWPDVHRWCFKTFGLDVNMGNIYPDELIYVEWSRKGLSRLSEYPYFK